MQELISVILLPVTLTLINIPGVLNLTLLKLTEVTLLTFSQCILHLKETTTAKSVIVQKYISLNDNLGKNWLQKSTIGLRRWKTSIKNSTIAGLLKRENINLDKIATQFSQGF